MKEDHLLDDLAPRKKRVIKKRKHISMKGLPVNVAMRRQAAEEFGEDPTRLQRDAVMMKYGIHDPVIDRNVKKPYWKSEVVWKNELKQFVQDTQGLVPRQRYQESRRGYTPKTASLNSQNLPRVPYPRGQNVLDRMGGRKWQQTAYPSRQMPLSRPTESKNSPRGS
jgi:hypothetical protein